jgi:uncharacterized membrane protein YfcA
MIIAGYFASLLIGVSLGLIGGGGSILTVPVLVYLFGVDPLSAMAYSLFIVGSSSLAGVYPKYIKGLVSIKTAIIFGIPSVISVFITRKYLVPSLPDPIFTIGGLIITKPLFLMIIFAILMLIASISMIKDRNEELNSNDTAPVKYNYPIILLQGTAEGFLTGLVGAGGGFLIIPALVMLSRLPMKLAIGTSLLIIAVKSLIGFMGDFSASENAIDWSLLFSVTGLAIIGIIIGNQLSLKVDGKKLKKGFGWFVLLMGIYVLLKELLF